MVREGRSQQHVGRRSAGRDGHGNTAADAETGSGDDEKRDVCGKRFRACDAEERASGNGEPAPNVREQNGSLRAIV